MANPVTPEIVERSLEYKFNMKCPFPIRELPPKTFSQVVVLKLPFESLPENHG